MDTKPYKYRVIWADDEVLDIVSDEDREILLEEENVDIIDRVTTGEALQESAYRFQDVLDAIIVDANFDARNANASERTITGLNRAFDLYRQLNGKLKLDIPFYLYTNRTDQFLFENRDEDYIASINEMFVETGRVFKKSDGYSDLIKQIKQEIDAKSTPLFMFRRTYAREFNAAELIPGVQELLIKGLLFQFDTQENYSDTQYLFNPARMIWESIEDQCKKEDILPPISQLNSMADFLLGNKVEGYMPTEQIMPRSLAHALKYFLSITQDGSHKKDDLSLGVVQYVRDTKNVNLYRSILYIAMDLLLWYEDCLKNEKKLLWKAEYVYVGVVKSTTVKDADGKRFPRFYSGRYSLLPHRDKQGQLIPLHEGDLIGVTSEQRCRENNPSYTGEDGTLVDKTLMDYVVLEKKE